MRKTRSVMYGDAQEATVRELTVLEIDGLFDLAERRSMTTLDNMLDVHNITAPILAAMCGVDEDGLRGMIGHLPPSGYAPLIQAAREANPDFFAMARNLKDRAGMLANLGKILDSVSESASVSASSTVITMPGATA